MPMPAQNEAVMTFDYQGAVNTCLLDTIIILLSGNASLLNPVLCICIQLLTLMQQLGIAYACLSSFSLDPKYSA